MIGFFGSLLTAFKGLSIKNVLSGGLKAITFLGGAARSIYKSFKSNFLPSNRRTFQDVYGMSDQLGYNFDPNSSLSQRGLINYADTPANSETTDFKSLPKLLTELNRLKDRNNKLGEYDGRY